VINLLRSHGAGDHRPGLRGLDHGARGSRALLLRLFAQHLVERAGHGLGDHGGIEQLGSHALRCLGSKVLHAVLAQGPRHGERSTRFAATPLERAHLAGDLRDARLGHCLVLRLFSVGSHRARECYFVALRRCARWRLGRCRPDRVELVAVPVIRRAIDHVPAARVSATWFPANLHEARLMPARDSPASRPQRPPLHASDVLHAEIAGLGDDVPVRIEHWSLAVGAPAETHRTRLGRWQLIRLAEISVKRHSGTPNPLRTRHASMKASRSGSGRNHSPRIRRVAKRSWSAFSTVTLPLTIVATTLSSSTEPV
jgi:hypothetical protein